MTRRLLPIALAILLPAQAYAFIDGARRGGTSCGGCHGSTASPSVTTTVSGLSAILAGTTRTYTASISPQLGVGAGVNVAIATGSVAGATIGNVDANTRINNAQLVHNDGGSNVAAGGNIGDWAYDFTVTAPMTLGSILLNVAMLAFDGDGSESDTDLWDPVQFSIQVIPEPGTIVLLGAGIAGLAAIGRRRPSQSKR